jgi:hypothetical protein
LIKEAPGRSAIRRMRNKLDVKVKRDIDKGFRIVVPVLDLGLSSSINIEQYPIDEIMEWLVLW